MNIFSYFEILFYKLWNLQFPVKQAKKIFVPFITLIIHIYLIFIFYRFSIQKRFFKYYIYYISMLCKNMMLFPFYVCKGFISTFHKKSRSSPLTYRAGFERIYKNNFQKMKIKKRKPPGISQCLENTSTCG